MQKTIVTVTLNPAIDLACTVPEFTAGEVNRVAEYRTDPGGKGVNIARLLRQFDLPVAATGFLGEDNPQIFERLFQKQGITDAFVRVPGETRIGVKILDPEAHTTTDINFPGLAPDPENRAVLVQTVRDLARQAAIVVIAGSLPSGLSPVLFEELVRAAKESGAKAVVDTSGSALHHAIDAAPWLIKPNTQELGAYVGRALVDIAEIVREARKLVLAGIHTVAVSLGSQGAVFVEARETLLTRPPKVKAASTVGAGDAMVGCLVAGLALGFPLEERVRLATAVSAAVVTQQGPFLPSLAAARQLEEQVAVEQITF